MSSISASDGGAAAVTVSASQVAEMRAFVRSLGAPAEASAAERALTKPAGRTDLFEKACSIVDKLGIEPEQRSIEGVIYALLGERVRLAYAIVFVRSLDTGSVSSDGSSLIGSPAGPRDAAYTLRRAAHKAERALARRSALASPVADTMPPGALSGEAAAELEAGLREEIEALRGEKDQIAAEREAVRADLEESQCRLAAVDAAIADLRARSAAELEASTQRIAALERDVSSSGSALAAARAELATLSEAKRLLEEGQAGFEARARSAEEARGVAAQALIDKTREFDQLREDLERDLRAARDQIVAEQEARQEAVTRATRETLEAQREETRRQLEQVAAEHQRSIEAKVEELEATASASLNAKERELRADSEQAIAEIRAQQAREMEAAAQRHASELDRARRASGGELTGALSDQERRLSEEHSAEKARIQEEHRRKLAQASAEKESALGELREALMAEKSAAIQALREEQNEAAAGIRAAHAAEKESLEAASQARLQEVHDDTERQLREKTEEHQRLLQAKVQELDAARVAAVSAREAELELDHRRAMAEVRAEEAEKLLTAQTRHAAALAQAAQASGGTLTDSLEAQRSTLTATYEAEKGRIEEQAERRLARAVEEKESALRALRREMEEEKSAELAALREHYDADLTSARQAQAAEKETFEGQLRSQREALEEEVSNAQAAASERLRELTDEAAAAKSLASRTQTEARAVRASLQSTARERDEWLATGPSIARLRMLVSVDEAGAVSGEPLAPAAVVPLVERVHAAWREREKRDATMIAAAKAAASELSLGSCPDELPDAQCFTLAQLQQMHAKAQAGEEKAEAAARALEGERVEREAERARNRTALSEAGEAKAAAIEEAQSARRSADAVGDSLHQAEEGIREIAVVAEVPMPAADAEGDAEAGYWLSGVVGSVHDLIAKVLPDYRDTRDVLGAGEGTQLVERARGVVADLRAHEDARRAISLRVSGALGDSAAGSDMPISSVVDGVGTLADRFAQANAKVDECDAQNTHIMTELEEWRPREGDDGSLRRLRLAKAALERYRTDRDGARADLAEREAAIAEVTGSLRAFQEMEVRALTSLREALPDAGDGDALDVLAAQLAANRSRSGDDSSATLSAERGGGAGSYHAMDDVVGGSSTGGSKAPLLGEKESEATSCCVMCGIGCC